MEEAGQGWSRLAGAGDAQAVPASHRDTSHLDVLEWF